MKKASMFMVLMLAAGLLISGCAENFDEISYTYPNWTPEGLIYSIKSVTHRIRRPGGLGFGTVTETLGTDYYYVTMDTEGNNEATLPYSSYPYYSPKGTYVALISGGKISIVRRSDNQTVYEFTPAMDSISELDWGPEEDKLVYTSSDGQMFVVNIDGSNPVSVNSIEALEIGWKYNSNIVCFNAASGTSFLSFVDPTNATIETTSLGHSLVGSYPQYFSDGNYIFTAGDTKIYKIDVSSKIIVASYDINMPIDESFTPFKLSPDNQKVVGGFTLQNGIWIVGIDGTNYKQLK